MASSFVVLCAKQDAAIDCRPGMPFTRIGLHTYVCGGRLPVPPLGDQIFSSWGSGTLQGTFIGKGTSLPIGVSHPPQEIGIQIRGSLTLLMWDRNGTVYVLADPLANGLVYMYEASVGTFVSPDLGSLVELLGEMGLPPLRKSLLYPLSYLATGAPGGGGLVSCSYEDVSVLEPFTFVRCDDRGAVTLTYDGLRDYWRDDGRSWNEGVNRIAEDIRLNLEAVRGSRAKHHVAHLTGGFDSRTVFAGLQGEDDRTFAYSCDGRDNSPDKTVALGLASTYDATFTGYTGLSYWRQPSTVQQAELWPVMDSFGMIQSKPTMYTRSESTVVLAGGCGELMRTQSTPASLSPEDSAREAAEHRWGPFGFSKDQSQRLFTRDAMNIFLRPIKEAISLVRDNGIAPEYWQEVFYMLRRNRYFVGQISRGWSAYIDRFDPLYSLESMKTIVRQPRETVATAALQIDVMNALLPGIAWYPYDTPRLGKEYESLRGRAPERDFSNSKVHYNDWTNPVASPYKSPLFAGLTASDVDKARKLRTTALRAHYAGFYRKRTGDLVSEYRRELSDLVDVGQLMTIINRSERHDWSFRQTHSLYYGLSYYAGELPEIV